MTKENRKYIGEVGVDSGQLMVCDPCYVDSEWENRKYHEDRAVKDTKTGKVYEFGKDFKQYDEVPKLTAHTTGTKGKTFNDLLESGRFVDCKLPNPYKGNFSYAGACDATTNSGKVNAGQLNYRLGHAGAGVAFSSGYGDGVYPVYATYNDEGRIIKVEIIMD